MIERRLGARPNRDPKVTVEVMFGNGKVKFGVRDEEPDFDPTATADTTASENLDKPPDLGLMRAVMDDVCFHARNIEVMLGKRRESVG